MELKKEEILSLIPDNIELIMIQLLASLNSGTKYALKYFNRKYLNVFKTKDVESVEIDVDMFRSYGTVCIDIKTLSGLRIRYHGNINIKASLIRRCLPDSYLNDDTYEIIIYIIAKTGLVYTKYIKISHGSNHIPYNQVDDYEMYFIYDEVRENNILVIKDKIFAMYYKCYEPQNNIFRVPYCILYKEDGTETTEKLDISLVRRVDNPC